MHSFLSLASGVVVLISGIPYVISIWRGRSTPNRVTWFVWASVGLLIAFTYHDLEGKAGFVLTVVGAAYQIFIALLSIKYGSGGVSVLDRTCFALVVLTSLLWWATQSSFYPYVFAVIIDLFAVIPTFSKAYHHPKSEDLLAWTICMVGVFLSVLAIRDWSFTEALFPLYAFFVELTVVLLLLRGNLSLRSK